MQLDGFRFYGCSLLLIYDGDRATQGHYSKHLRLGTLDEADEEGSGVKETTGRQGGKDVAGDEERDEFAEHRHRPDRSSSRRQDEPEAGRRSRSVDVKGGAVTGRQYTPVDSNIQPHSHSHSHHHHPRHSHTHTHTAHKSDNSRRIRGEVNIRVVDFAHTTTGRDFLPFPSDLEEDTSSLGKGYETKWDESTGLALARFPPKHRAKPDMGFIFGLKNVCEALEVIWTEHKGEGIDWEEVRREFGLDPIGDEERDVFVNAFELGDEEDYLSV